MTPVVAATAMYFLAITFSSEKGGQEIAKEIVEVAKIFNSYQAGVKIVNKFKVVGEAKVIAVVEANNITSLACLVQKIWGIANVDTDATPVITYESYARNLGVADNLTKPFRGVLRREKLYLLTMRFDYYGFSTKEYLAIRKKQVEIELSRRLAGESLFITYKKLAERQTETFLNVEMPEQLDIRVFDFHAVQVLGSNVHMETKGLQLLDDYKICASY